MKVFATQDPGLKASYIARVGIVGGVETTLSSIEISPTNEAALQAFFNPRIELTMSTSFDLVGVVASNPDIHRNQQNYYVVYRPGTTYAMPTYTDEQFPMLGLLDDTTALYSSPSLPAGNQLDAGMETLLDTLIASVP